MTPQERDLILGLFQRLKPPPEGDIDGEARELIEGLVRQQPLAPYLLAQTALVQDYALKGAQARIANLEAKLAQASSAAAPETPRRSFLSGLLSGEAPGRQAFAAAPAAAPQAAAPAPAGPWGSRGGPSFLQSALSTAAGVAGGALLFQGIEHLLGYGGSPFAGAAGVAQPVEDITVNNFEQAPQDVSAPDPGNDPSLDTTQVDDPGFDQGGLGDDNGFQDV
ncbi:MAG TPA: DUF2076 domain-containing protein [Verrucomicrobiae bacterium]|jgi:hypothetical protein|nr:DUF2076 domain-containing protein [Verrucomicrobiae bacterium]